MKELNLGFSELTQLTELDLINLCELNNIKPDELTDLFLYNNNLKNIRFIQENTPFINIMNLWLNYNPITDLKPIKYLKNLRYLNIDNLPKLKNKKETEEILENLPNLTHLYKNKTLRSDFNIKPLNNITSGLGTKTTATEPYLKGEIINKTKLSFKKLGLTEITEEQLTDLCYLNRVDPENIKSIDLSSNKLINLNCFTKNTPFINLTELNLGNTELKYIYNNIKYLPKLNILIIDDKNMTQEEFNKIKKLKNIKAIKSGNHYGLN